MTHHYEASTFVPAEPDAVFARLDDQSHLGEHMGKSSAMMGGGKMTYRFDKGRGLSVGSHVGMDGEAFGLKLSVDEVVTERAPPARKAWKTVGAPRLLIIDQYEMGFTLEPHGSGSRLTVWIDYALPVGPVAAAASSPFAAMYARWCVNQMVEDAQSFFERRSRVSA